MPVLLLVTVLLKVVSCNPPIYSQPPCLEYGGCRHPSPHYHPHPHKPHHNPFVPAPPGKTPACAKYGQTFCEKIDRYPMHLIRYLVDHWVYDYRTLLSDESRTELPKPKPLKPTYGPPPHPTRPPYGPYPPALYPPINNNINLTQDGYPDRRYPLPPSANPWVGVGDPGFIYSALLQPDVTPYDPSHWWKRYSRSSEESSRAKRQLGGGGGGGGGDGQDIQLCPTRGQFVSPKAALNTDGNWMYVVNLEQDQNSLTQQVRAETCITNQCNGICSLPNGYTSRCQQQYVQKRLIALEGSGNQLYTDTFWLPHCCICQITPINNG